MKSSHISQTGRRGWYIGDFPQAVLQTNSVEVCYTTEPAGPLPPHYHQRCWETILIVKGEITCQGREFRDGDILVFEPGDVNDMCCTVETTVVAVKTPAGGNDKILV